MKTEIIISSVALFVSGIAAIISIRTYLHNKVKSIASAYLTLREKFRNIYISLPYNHRDPNFTPKEGSEEWRSIEAYWFHIFDEWFICNKINKTYLEWLWKEHYKHNLTAALSRNSLRIVLEGMIEREMSFGGNREEFIKELQTIDPTVGNLGIE